LKKEILGRAFTCQKGHDTPPKMGGQQFFRRKRMIVGKDFALYREKQRGKGLGGTGKTQTPYNKRRREKKYSPGKKTP